MATTQNPVLQDPLGLQRFALTESAYDLVNSLKGSYARLSHAESQKTNPDADQITRWRNRSREIGRSYRRLNNEDLSAIEDFIKSATIEWREMTELENRRILTLSHVS